MTLVCLAELIKSFIRLLWTLLVLKIFLQSCETKSDTCWFKARTLYEPRVTYNKVFLIQVCFLGLHTVSGTSMWLYIYNYVYMYITLNLKVTCCSQLIYKSLLEILQAVPNLRSVFITMNPGYTGVWRGGAW